MRYYGQTSRTGEQRSPQLRLRIWYGVLIAICVLFVLRLFYLQVLRHNYYQNLALAGQLKQYTIPAERGAILAESGSQTVPIVLNEKKFNVVADPTIIKDKQMVAEKLAPVIQKQVSEVKDALNTDSQYVIIVKKLDEPKRDEVRNLKLPGIFVEQTSQRVYPQGVTAAQILGFVDDEGVGKYGVEQFLDKQLKGSAGKVKSITDQKGVPLLASGENVQIDPKDGDKVVLTIDIGMQKQLEEILKTGVEQAKSEHGSAIIINPNTGAIKAMANWPTYDPAKFNEVKQEDQAVFQNSAVSEPLEPGSTIKTLTTAAALDQGVINANTSYYDPGFARVDDKTITNVEEVAGAGTRTIQDILKKSLNTGAVFMLRQMGGGEINEKARNAWHDYLTNHYQLGKLTGVEQGYEAEGDIPDPNNGYGLNIQYANTSFGQGMTMTILQLAAAESSVVNGGTYYKPHLVEKTISVDNKTTETGAPVVKKDVVKPEVSATLRQFMQFAMENNSNTKAAARSGYSVGGKTGTAQVPNPNNGGYYEDRYNGTYVGFVGGDMPQYVIVVRVDAPKIGGYAGTKAAAPIFVSLANMLMNNYNVVPKSQ